MVLIRLQQDLERKKEAWCLPSTVQYGMPYHKYMVSKRLDQYPPDTKSSGSGKTGIHNTSIYRVRTIN
jgi:hypothetical protein